MTKTRRSKSTILINVGYGVRHEIPNPFNGGVRSAKTHGRPMCHCPYTRPWFRAENFLPWASVLIIAPRLFSLRECPCPYTPYILHFPVSSRPYGKFRVRKSLLKYACLSVGKSFSRNSEIKNARLFPVMSQKSFPAINVPHTGSNLNERSSHDT